MSHAAAPTRSLEEAATAVHHACNFGLLNERFWRKADTLLNLVGALGGSSAVAGVLASSASLTATAGVVVGVASVLQLVLRPSDRAVDFRDTRRQFLALKARMWDLDVVTLDAEMVRIEADAPIGAALLDVPAWNMTMLQLGHAAEVRPLSFLQRAASALT